MKRGHLVDVREPQKQTTMQKIPKSRAQEIGQLTRDVWVNGKLGLSEEI